MYSMFSAAVRETAEACSKAFKPPTGRKIKQLDNRTAANK
jgi:hypothetical protein